MPFDPTKAPQDGPCLPWCEISDVRACGLSDVDVDDATVEWGIQLATKLLWAATGRRYGICERTVRPCYSGDHSYGAHGYGSGHGDTYSRGYAAGFICSCSLPLLQLPGPIADVEQIMIDGQILDFTAYGIKRGGFMSRKALVRTDGDCWPCCNDLESDPTTVPVDAGTCPAWSVTYYKGRVVPPEAVGIAAGFAEQLARAKCGGKCAEGVSGGTTSIARRGVKREFESPTRTQAMGLIHDLPTYARDWVYAVNPHGLKSRPKVVRASDPEPRRIWEWL